MIKNFKKFGVNMDFILVIDKVEIGIISIGKILYVIFSFWGYVIFVLFWIDNKFILIIEIN